MGTKMKLCGLFRTQDIDYANRLLTDYVGFVLHFPKSHRSIDGEKAKQLKERLSPKIKAVGVFVNEKAEICAALANGGVIDLIQLHGGENAAYLQNLKTLTDAPIIKAVKVTSPNDVEQAQTLGADYLLLDGGTGSGKTFDHSLIENTEIRQPFFLAGGLSADNIGTVIKKFHPFAVDVSSAIETGGLKDYNKMAAFVNAVRKDVL